MYTIRSRMRSGDANAGSERFLERAKGFEPSTPTLARLCSTPELHPHPISGRWAAGRVKSYAKWWRAWQLARNACHGDARSPITPLTRCAEAGARVGAAAFHGNPGD